MSSIYELEYWFGKDGEDEFIYGVDIDDVIDFLIRTHGEDDIIETYYDYIYPHLQDFEQRNVDGMRDLITDDTDKKMFIEEIIENMLDEGIYEEELHDYFEEDAVEEYNDDVYPYDVKF